MDIPISLSSKQMNFVSVRDLLRGSGRSVTMYAVFCRMPDGTETDGQFWEIQ